MHGKQSGIFMLLRDPESVNFFLLVKTIHISSAVISFLGFASRGRLMLKASPWLTSKLIRVAPHVVDTVLLLSAIVLVILSRQYPFAASWLTLKLVLLILYIVLGSIALKRGKTKQIRIAALVLALATISSIFVVAVLKPARWA